DFPAAQVPPRIGCQRHGNLRREETAKIVSVGVGFGYKHHVVTEDLRRLAIDNAALLEIGAKIDNVRPLDHFGIAHARDAGEARRFLMPVHKRAFVNSRMHTGRWLDAVSYPGIQSVKQSPEEWPVIAGIGQILGYSAAWRIASRTMLRAAKRVNADLGR